MECRFTRPQANVWLSLSLSVPSPTAPVPPIPLTHLPHFWVAAAAAEIAIGDER